jgi:hypothetical protein
MKKIGDFGLEDYDAQYYRELDPQNRQMVGVDPKTRNQESIVVLMAFHVR